MYNQEKQQTRNYKYDTIRFIMIFFVIVGHAMELFYSEKISYIYQIIYSFHIPVLIYITGMFARFDKQKIIKHLIFPYLVFQLIYQIFHAILFGNQINIQFTTPYWILWYLLSIIIYYILIPMFPDKKTKHVYTFLFLSIIFALIIGFENSIGYYMSLSRTFYFFPFFIMGYYHDKLLDLLENKRVVTLCTVIIIIGTIYMFKYYVSNSLFMVHILI